jgi:hypothetical protein
MQSGWAVVRRPYVLALLATLATVLPLSWTWTAAQGPVTFNEREVKTDPSALEKKDIWALDFRFKDPRLIKINIPGRGTRVCWYLWYQVINRTGEPRTFIPDFDLVTLDTMESYPDEVLPKVEEAIRKLEDPTGYQDIKNSVTITSQPIPPSKAADEAYPRAVTGVAIWDDVPTDPKQKKISESSRFTIFVSGLSNGWVVVDPMAGAKDTGPVIRRKTLQLNFKRVGDRNLLDARDINFVAPAEWMYRASQIRLPEQPAAKEKM